MLPAKIRPTMLFSDLDDIFEFGNLRDVRVEDKDYGAKPKQVFKDGKYQFTKQARRPNLVFRNTISSYVKDGKLEKLIPMRQNNYKFVIELKEPKK